jgi:DNA-binding NarL/FixJ family response regulator
MNPLQISKSDALQRLKILSPRQRKVLLLLTCGYSYKEISNILRVTRRTVRYHLFKACIRLDAETPLQAAILMARSRQ